MNAITELRQGLSEGWRSIAEGWKHVRERASGAMTRYRPLPARQPAARGDDHELALATPAWGLLFGEVFEDRDRVVVRLEAPGMDVKDFDLQVHGDILTVKGEKRLARESGDGRYRMLECAYGTFERSIRLPAAVRMDKCSARYRNGVLRIELPKLESRAPRAVKVRVK
ncbi:MAG TPA: Hsp20/alpha crystallin family protein [Usitatibacter sp.]|nr:Hsp20/alpha crystallin family protein [Usitatibacter sp.]